MNTRPPDYTTIHDEDNISTIKGVGETALKKFNSRGIFLVRELNQLSDQEAATLQSTARIGRFNSIRTAVCAAAPGKNPYPIVNLTKTNYDGSPTDNPYQARYGDTWREEIKNSTALGAIVCITDMIRYMMEESARVMAGTKHENDWYFYHDALSLMTAKQTREWMRNNDIDGKNCMDKWLVPMMGCNQNTPFEHRSVGNSPVFMPLDMSLNQDLKINHDFHCAVTAHLPIDDERKFSNSTPKLISRGVKRLVEGHLPDEGVPSSDRIMHDCDQALNAMRIVCEHNGAIVQGLANRNGHRYSSRGTRKQGGAKVKVEVLDKCKWLHPTVEKVKNDKQKEIILRSLRSDIEEESDIFEDCVPTENEHVD